MFLQFPEPVLGRTRCTRKDSVSVTEFFGIGMRRAGQGVRTESFESVRTTRDGRRIPVSMTVSPLLDAAGQVMGVAKVTRDISTRLAADQEIQTLNKDLRQLLRHVTGLREIDQSIASSAGLSITLNLVLDNVRQQLGADVAAALVSNPSTLALEYAAARGFSWDGPVLWTKLIRVPFQGECTAVVAAWVAV